MRLHPRAEAGQPAAAGEPEGGGEDPGGQRAVQAAGRTTNVGQEMPFGDPPVGFLSNLLSKCSYSALKIMNTIPLSELSCLYN